MENKLTQRKKRKKKQRDKEGEKKYEIGRKTNRH